MRVAGYYCCKGSVSGDASRDTRGECIMLRERQNQCLLMSNNTPIMESNQYATEAASWIQNYPTSLDK